jgi:TolB-like protein
MASNCRPLALPDKPSIAVLPFQNMSGDVEQEYFADGMVASAKVARGISRLKRDQPLDRTNRFSTADTWALSQ